MPYVLLALALLCSLALALRAEIPLTLDQVIESGDIDAVKDVLPSSFHFLRSSSFMAAYSKGHLEIIDYLLKYVRSKKRNPKIPSSAEMFFKDLACSEDFRSEDPTIRSAVMDRLVASALQLPLSSIVRCLNRIGDTDTLEKLKKAAASDSRIELLTLEDALVNDDESLFNKLLYRGEEEDHCHGLVAAISLGKLEEFNMILTSGRITACLWNTLVFAMERRGFAHIPIGDLEYIVIKLIDMMGINQFKQYYELNGDRGIPELLKVLRERVGNISFLPQIIAARGSLQPQNDLISSSPAKVAGSSITIDGGGTWDKIRTALEDPTTAQTDSITISNTGTTSFPKRLPTGLDVSVLATHLTLTNIPNFSAIPWGFFLRMRSITTLTLSNLGLKTVSTDSFEGLDHIETLDLSYNQFEDLPDLSTYDMESLTRIDLTGNPIVRGCIAHGLDGLIVPDDLLPPCNYQSLKPWILDEYPSDPVPLISRLEPKFRCSEDPEFLKQHARHVYKVGFLQGSHYGLVFIFDTGIMLSELVVVDSTTQPTNRIYSKCVKTPRDAAHEEELATLMFTASSPIFRGIMPKPPSLYDIDERRCYSYGNMEIPEHSGLTGQSILDRCSEYERDHPKFALGRDSCVTFAHVFYRDLFN